MDSNPVKPNARFSRARHRARQHESAHADASSHGPERIVDHPLVPRGAGELIITHEALAEFISHLRQQKQFAYDSEFIGELSYHPQLCLVQASTTQRIGLIDPMIDLDLTSFWELLADETVEKIVHAGEQDIEPVHRLIGRPAANVFDTQIAAGFVGLAYPIGLSKLVGELTGAKLGKGFTFSHWDHRPLSSQQLKYAAADVRYLPAVRAEIGRRLEELGHTAWAREECDSLCDPARYAFDFNNDFLRLRGAGSLTPQGLAILRELMAWRDSAARAENAPSRAFLKDEILVAMAQHPVRSLDRLSRVKGLPKPVEMRHGEAILAAVARGLAVPAGDQPRMKNVEPSPSERFSAESLHAAACAICAGQSIDPALVTSRQEIAELHRAMTAGGDLPDLRVLRGWRAAACGNRLVDLFYGKTTLRIRCVDGRLQLEK